MQTFLLRSFQLEMWFLNICFIFLLTFLTRSVVLELSGNVVYNEQEFRQWYVMTFSDSRAIALLVSLFPPDPSPPTRQEKKIATIIKGILESAVLGDIDVDEDMSSYYPVYAEDVSMGSYSWPHRSTARLRETRQNFLGVLFDFDIYHRVNWVSVVSTVWLV